MPKLLSLLLALVLLAACASGPRYPTAGVADELTPAEAATAAGMRGTRVIWGGVIVATRNLSQATEIEVLGYPLDRGQKPITGRTPQGRFLVHQSGYLEEVDYAPGRHITVTGMLGDTLEGRVGEASYRFPLVDARAIHLWPRETRGDTGSTRFNIGVGVIFSR